MSAFMGTQRSAAAAEWIKTCPPGWILSRLKWTASATKNGIWGDEAEGGPADIVCIRVADFDRQRLLVNPEASTLRKVSIPQRRGRLLKTGDLLLEKSGGGEKQPVGAVVLFCGPEPAVCSNFISRVVPELDQSSRFLNFLHASLYFRGINERSIKQTTGIQNLDAQLYFDEIVALPPLEAQKKISAFLDQKTAAIDALIEKKERLIELLEEKRVALVHRAVTKGLDPEVPMKDSGVPWIGEIPSHWEVIQLRRLIVEFGQGWSPTADDRARDPAEWAVLKLSAVKNGRFVPTEHKTLPSELLPRPELVPKAEDLLITRANTPELVGDCCVVPETPNKLMISDLIFRVRLDKRAVDPLFASYFFRSPRGRMQVSFGARGSSRSMIKISQGHVREWLLPQPPLAEQLEISIHLKALESFLDAGISKVADQIEKLQEYRQALITAAVTGQLDLDQETA